MGERAEVLNYVKTILLIIKRILVYTYLLYINVPYLGAQVIITLPMEKFAYGSSLNKTWLIKHVYLLQQIHYLQTPSQSIL
jgi:hypothetical protein